MNNSSTKKQSISSSAKSKGKNTPKKNKWQFDSSTKSNLNTGASLGDGPALTKGTSLKFKGKNRESNVVVEIEDQDEYD